MIIDCPFLKFIYFIKITSSSYMKRYYQQEKMQFDHLLYILVFCIFSIGISQLKILIWTISQSNRDRSRSNSNYSDRSQKGSGSNFAPPSRKLFIGNITSEMDETDLRSTFEKIGKVTDFFVKINQGKGFGFVQYGSQEQADEAIKNLNGKKISGKMIYVKYKTEKPKGERNGFNGGGQNQRQGGFKPRQQRQFKPFNGGNRNQGKPYQRDNGNSGGKGNFNNRGGENGGYKGGFKGGQNGFKGKFNGDGQNRFGGKKYQSDNKQVSNQAKEQGKPQQYDY